MISNDHIGMRASSGRVVHLFDLSAKYGIDDPVPLTAVCGAVRMRQCVVLTEQTLPTCTRCTDSVERRPSRSHLEAWPDYEPSATPRHRSFVDLRSEVEFHAQQIARCIEEMRRLRREA